MTKYKQAYVELKSEVVFADDPDVVILKAYAARAARCSARLSWRSFSPAVELCLWVDRTCLWRPWRCCSRKSWRGRVTQVHPQPLQPACYVHADMAEWKDAWNIRKWRTPRWFSPGMSGSLRWLACRRPPIHAVSRALACWLFRQEGQLQSHAVSGSEPELLVTQQSALAYLR